MKIFLTTFATLITGGSDARTGRSALPNRLHQPYTTLEKQFLTFLRDGLAAGRGREISEPKQAATGAISNGAGSLMSLALLGTRDEEFHQPAITPW